MKLKFVDVGRNKKSWEVEVPDSPDHMTNSAIAKSIRKSHSLASRDLEWEIDLDAGVGAVFAGMRRVGSIEVLAPVSPAKEG